MQARAVGDELVVGLVPDSEIRRCKGPPVQNQEERRVMVEAVKWVGQVITGLPLSALLLCCLQNCDVVWPVQQVCITTPAAMLCT